MRVAVVIGVGTATIASAIGAGGLGDYIFRGLAMVDPTVILAGARAGGAAGARLPTARWRWPAASPIRADGRAAAVRAGRARLLVVAGAAVWASGLGSRARRRRRLEELHRAGGARRAIAQAIERHGLNVERRLNLGGTAIAHQALVSGDIDVYVEYTGTALTAIFNQPPSTDSDARRSRSVRERYAAPASRCCRGLASTTRLRFWCGGRRRASGWPDDDRRSRRALRRRGRAGFGYEFLERPDGFPAWRRLRPAVSRRAARHGPQPDLSRAWPRARST